MSSGSPTDTTPDPQANLLKSTAIALGLCLAMAVIFYFVMGKSLIEGQKLASATNQKMEAVSAELSKAEDQNQQTQSAIDAIQQKLNSPTVTSQQLDELLTRLKQLESGREEQNKALRGLSQQASAAAGDRARNRVLIVEAAKLGESVETELAGLEAEITTWTGVNAGLPKGEAGRRIAEFPDLVTQYAALSEAPLVRFDDHDRWRQQLKALYPRIKTAYEKEEFVAVSQEDIRLLSDLLDQIQSSRKTLKQHQRSLNLLIAAARDTDPGQRNLEDVIAARKAAQDAAYLEQLAASKTAAKQAADAAFAEKIAEEQRKQQEKLNQQKLKAAELETGRQQAELDRIGAEAEKRRLAQAKAKLAQEFERERTVINSLLSPFLDHAITQPSRTNPITKGGIKRPTSLGALKSSGALGDNEAGLNALYHAGGHPANMRKKGGFPSFISMSPIPNDSVRQQVRRAQQLLNKYGELLVEKGLLSQ